MGIGFLSVFIGGVLALLSPCAALLLPAFFAASVGRRVRLLVHGAVFYLGTLLVLAPLGLGVGFVGSLLTQYRGIVIAATAIILVVFGVLQLFGVGFDAARLVPGARSAQQRASGRSGLVRTLLLGISGGVAGFCVGPILGAVLTFAASSANAVTGALLMAVYGAGMVVPLIAIAALWERLGSRGQRWLRGRPFTFLGRTWHTTSVVTGLLLIVVGVVFWLTNGFISMPQLVPDAVVNWLQSGASVLANPFVDAAVIALIAASIITWWALRRNANAAK